MAISLTGVLIKIFVRGFYRNHAGSLLFFFVGIFSYCFFIQVLNQTHLNPADRIIQNLLFVLTLLTSPPLVLVVFIGWIGFTIKSYQYILGELKLPANQFLFYSATALKRQEVFKSWFIVQTLISIPLLIFASFSLIVGISYQYYLTPIVIFFFILLLNCITSLFLTIHFYNHGSSFQQSTFSKISSRWHKPFYTLFLYYSMAKLPLTLALTKALSFGCVMGISYLLQTIANTVIVGGFIALSISVVHSFLLFESSRFEMQQLLFVRNFPWSRAKIYLSWVFTIGLILLPESIWLLFYFKWIGLVLWFLSLSICLLLRSLLYRIQLHMKSFLYWVFWVFTFSFIGILFNIMLVASSLILVASWLIFTRFYYRNDWNRIILRS